MKTKYVIKTNPEVEKVFNNYPKEVLKKIVNLRRLILEVANEIKEIKVLEETLKWGEPSYIVKNGSTIRIDWKKKTPDCYAMYFKCTTKLVTTFKVVYGSTFTYEKNRALIFNMEDVIPEMELRSCIESGLTYHTVKLLPLLGLQK
jgi:hypothetical protein